MHRGLPAIGALALTLATACSGSPHVRDRPGFVTGQAPICYGPGPDLNLSPWTTIRATPLGGAHGAAIVRVHTTGAHHAYRIQLAPGRYVISSYSGSVVVTVRPGVTLRGVDLPQPGCL